ncbi:MAG: hypothetical protein WA705_12425 [Candidatus Ozemobacteraceae bacterium]
MTPSRPGGRLISIVNRLPVSRAPIPKNGRKPKKSSITDDCKSRFERVSHTLTACREALKGFVLTHYDNQNPFVMAALSFVELAGDEIGEIKRAMDSEKPCRAVNV